MSLIPFPNVPQVPGVPQLNRLNTAVNTATLAAQSVASLLGGFSKPVWGIFDTSNNPVAVAESVYAFDYRAEWNIPDYTIEAGSFASYNKVVKPFETSVRLMQGGSFADRQRLLADVQNIAGDTNKYNIQTAEKTYLNVNVTRVELLRRSNEGAAFLEIDVYFREIRESTGQYGSIATANASNPAAIPSTSLGNVQPQTVIPAPASAAVTEALTQAPM